MRTVFRLGRSVVRGSLVVVSGGGGASCGRRSSCPDGTGSLTTAGPRVRTGVEPGWRTEKRPGPLARTTATPTAVVSGTASTSPIEPTRMRMHLRRELLGLHDLEQRPVVDRDQQQHDSDAPAVAKAMV